MSKYYNPALKGLACHKLIAQTAQDMAREVYASFARASNEWHSENRNEEEYVKESWPLYIEAARTTLAELLSVPSTAELLKEQIYDALCKDNAIRRGRTLQVQPGRH